MSTNIQAFSGDVEISSNVLMSSNVFIKGPGPTSNVVAVGIEAGYTTQGIESVAIGHGAGQYNQGCRSIAVGAQAGQTDLGAFSIAVGRHAAQSNQGSFSVAVGPYAGQTDQGIVSTAVGPYAGQTSQANSAIAVGYFAGQTSQAVFSIAVGREAGQTNQGYSAIAVGRLAGQTSQGSRGIAIGEYAGNNTQGSHAVAVGYSAGMFNQGSRATAVGWVAGQTNQGYQTTAMGYDAGRYNQGAWATAVGSDAGYDTQGRYGTAVGLLAGQTSQGSAAVGVGWVAGLYGQGSAAIAIGARSGRYNQGSSAVAVGGWAGSLSQGENAIAIGESAGESNQPTNTTYFRFGSIRDANGNEYLHITNAGEFVRGNGYSDDRLKYDEKFITGAIKSLFKLRPQEYLKKPKLIPDPNHDEEWIHESGLMAQEVYYSAPELRHLVRVAETAGDIDTLTPAPSDDPSQDPDYSVWGDKPSGIKYIQFIPYLIKGIQEIVTELPRSKTTVSNTWDQNITGLVVSADTNTHKTNVTPIVSLSNVAMDKAWYGVVSVQKTDTNDYDTLVDTNGDTRIWVSDVGGSLESGDLVTTSNIAPGYAQKQSDDIVRNYTVGKVTQECDFTEPLQVSVKIPKKELSNVKYYVKNIIHEVKLSEYELYNSRHTTVETKPMYICEVQNGELNDVTRFYRGGVEVSRQPGEDIIEKYFLEKTPDEYELLDNEEKAKYTLSTRNIYKVHSQTRSTRLIPEHEEEVFIEEMVDVLDANGQIVWEDTANTAPMYTLVDHGTHKAALLTCKLY